jgi:hypothetical protein
MAAVQWLKLPGAVVGILIFLLNPALPEAPDPLDVIKTFDPDKIADEVEKRLIDDMVDHYRWFGKVDHLWNEDFLKEDIERHIDGKITKKSGDMDSKDPEAFNREITDLTEKVFDLVSMEYINESVREQIAERFGKRW